MDDHNFMHFSWSPKRNQIAEIIETDDIDELNDMIEEQVEGYEEVNILEENSDNDSTSYHYIDDGIIHENDTQGIYHLSNDDGIMNNSTRIGVGMSHLIEQRVEEAENKIIGDQDAQEEFTAEVITEEDWIQSQGEEVVPIAMEQIVTSGDYHESEMDTVPLQTDQDEYTTSRPYPCDFCSRRFRKKANLINHMVAHQNVRPNVCNLCGSRYVRKCDLINHLKIHAYNIEDEAGPSTSGGKKKPTTKYEDLSFIDDYHDDDDEYDVGDSFGHYQKLSPPMNSSPSKNNKNKALGLGAGKKKPPPPPPKKVVKSGKNGAKVSREKSLSSSDFSPTPAKQPKKEYIERFPITDARKPFVCQTCGVAFTREKALESHSKVHINQETTIDCEVCGDSFFDNAALEEHMEIRHDYSARFKKTGGKTTGGKVPPNRTQLLYFDDSNSSNSEFEPDTPLDDMDNDSSDYEEDNLHVCDQCDMVFKSNDALKRHIKSVHFIKSELPSDEEGGSTQRRKEGSASSLGCNVCGESFTEALDLLAHAEIHARFQNFKCLLCGEAFLEENKIKMHLMENHRDEMTESSCKLCGKQCRDQRSLIKHSWEHSRDRAHSCSKCGKTFHNKARLKRHISSHRNKSVICEICHEEFTDGRQLMNHRHSHTKSNQFPCTECGKTFGSRSSQQIHIRIHTGERPYSCRFCWKAFADGGTLRKHERIHTGEKPYCCLVCPRAFNQRVVLREHIRSHHSAPDTVNGTSSKPFYCSLCADLFASSLELIHHLIEHSDRSTAAKRVAPTGPRKYKRRRRVSDAEAEISVQNSSETRISSRKTLKQNDKKDTTATKSSFVSTPDLKKISKKFTEFELPKDFFEVASRDKKDIGKKASSNAMTRAKMIFTEKTRVPVYDGKRKTRTLIQKKMMDQRSQEKIEKDKKKDSSDSGSETCSNEEDALNVLLKRERKLSEKFTVDLVNDLQEILRSPLKISEKIIIEEEDLLDTSRQQFEEKVQINTRRSAPLNCDIQTVDIKKDISSETEDNTSDNIVIKEEILHECGMCHDTFESHDELLSHVQIHI